jgi:hypothetical protein
MDENMLLSLAKERIEIKSTARDTYLQALIKGVLKELEDEKGIVLQSDNYNHIIFIIDYVAWKADGHEADDMPRNLQFRLHNLIIHNGSSQDVIL